MFFSRKDAAWSHPVKGEPRQRPSVAGDADLVWNAVQVRTGAEHGDPVGTVGQEGNGEGILRKSNRTMDW